MFSTADGRTISDEFVSVRILGGNDLDEVGEAFMRRYGVPGYPTLLAVTASGALVNGDLMDGRLRDAPYILDALRTAKKENDAFVVERDRLLAANDAESLTELAKAHEKRRDLAGARSALETILAADPEAPAETRLHLLSVLSRLEDKPAEHALLDDVLERYAEHERRTDWLVRRATMDIPRPTSAAERDTVIERFEEAIEGLRGDAAKAGRTAEEADLRVHLAAIGADKGDEEVYQGHVDWILERAPETPAAREVQMLRARRAMEVRDLAAAKEYATWVVEHGATGAQAAAAHQLLGDLAYGDDDWESMEKHFRAVLEAAPESRHAEIARQAIDAIERRKASMEAAAEPEDAKEEQPGDGPTDSE